MTEDYLIGRGCSMRGQDLILTYDIGTTGNKCTVFDQMGNVIAAVVEPYDTYYPRPGWSEQNPEDFIKSILGGTQRILKQYEIDPGDIAVIGLSGHMNGCLPVDKEGRVLYNNIIHSDGRTGKQCEDILNKFDGMDVYNITGNRVDPHYTLPKILWLKEHFPDVYSNTAYFLNTKDYVSYWLTGNLGITDLSDASLTNMLDIKKGVWAIEFIKELKIDANKLPRLYSSHDLAGTLTKEAAAALGLKEGTPVVVGGGDGACATKGAGVMDKGLAYNYIGSSSWISTLSEKPILDGEARIFNYYDLDGVHCNVTGTVQCATIAYDWVMDNLALYEKELADQGQRNIYEIIQEMAEDSPIGSNGVFFLPYLMGERSPYWDKNTRGAFIGFTLFHRRQDLFRAVYEGVAYALRSVLDVFDENGLEVERLTLIGGGAKSPLWNDIMCNVYRKPLVIHASPGEATSLGAAIAAGVGVGIFKDYKEAARIIDYKRELTPEPAKVEEYKKYYEVYKMMYPQLKSIYRAISQL